MAKLFNLEYSEERFPNGISKSFSGSLRATNILKPSIKYGSSDCLIACSILLLKVDVQKWILVGI